MKKKILVLPLAAALIIALVVSKSTGKNEKYVSETGENTPVGSVEAAFDEVAESGETETESVSKEEYTVKEYKDKIGIFKSTEDEPFIVLETYTFILPDRDRALLREGFVVDCDKLYSVIEDYTG